MEYWSLKWWGIFRRNKDNGWIYTEVQITARGSVYAGRLLGEEFKQRMNGKIWQRLMKSEHWPKNIEQWYERAVRLNMNCSESKRGRRRKKENKKGEKRREENWERVEKNWEDKNKKRETSR